MTVRGPFHRKNFRKILSEKKYGGAGLISEKTQGLYLELKERAEAASNNFSSI